MAETIDICVDCAFISENGTQGMEFPEGFVEAYAAAVDKNKGEPSVEFLEDGDFDDHFSWFPCDFCHSTLGGMRIKATFITH